MIQDSIETFNYLLPTGIRLNVFAQEMKLEFIPPISFPNFLSLTFVLILFAKT